jgi:antitoxin MazE
MEPTRPAGGYVWRDTSLGLAGRLISRPLGVPAVDLSAVSGYTHCIYAVEAIMRTRVQRWGNSLAVRIPKTFAEEVGLRDDSPVDLRLSQGKLVLEPSAPRPASLENLLSKVRKSNLHAEFDSGPAQGREAW